MLRAWPPRRRGSLLRVRGLDGAVRQVLVQAGGGHGLHLPWPLVQRFGDRPDQLAAGLSELAEPVTFGIESSPSPFPSAGSASAGFFASIPERRLMIAAFSACSSPGRAASASTSSSE